MTNATSPMSMIDVQLPRRYDWKKSRIASITVGDWPAFAAAEGLDDTKEPRRSGRGSWVSAAKRWLALRVLRCLASALQAELLALLGARIASQQASAAERCA